MPSIFRLLVGLLVLSVVVALGTSPAAAVGTITLTPSTGPVGATVQASGSGYRPGEAVNVFWGQAPTGPIASTKADPNGGFAATFTVPDVPDGRYQVSASGAASETSAQTFFSVSTPPSPSPTSTNTPTATATATPTRTPTPTPTPTVQRPIGAGGGEVSLNGGAATDGGVTVLVPAGAIGGGVTMTLGLSDTTPANVRAPSGTKLLGKTVEVTLDRPAGLRKAVLIRLNLTAADLQGTDVSRLQVGVITPGGGVDPKPTRVLNAADALVEVETDHFSKFTVLSATAPGPALSAPADQVTLTGLGTPLSWSNPFGATQYQIQVLPFANDGPGINLIRDIESSYTVQAPAFGTADPAYVMLPGMTYTWRVRTSNSPTSIGEDDLSWTAWSIRTFRTGPASPATLTLDAPAGGATVASLTPQLRWSDSNKALFYYEVQLSKDATFNTDPATASASVYWELRHGGATTPPDSYQVPASAALEPATTYHWRVRPRIQGDGDPLPWSPAASFRTP